MNGSNQVNPSSSASAPSPPPPPAGPLGGATTADTLPTNVVSSSDSRSANSLSRRNCRPRCERAHSAAGTIRRTRAVLEWGLTCVRARASCWLPSPSRARCARLYHTRCAAHALVKVDALEEGVALHLGGAGRSEALGRVTLQQRSDKALRRCAQVGVGPPLGLWRELELRRSDHT
eukprot:3230638-Prymnesium_polylepis.3